MPLINYQCQELICADKIRIRISLCDTLIGDYENCLYLVRGDDGRKDKNLK